MSFQAIRDCDQLRGDILTCIAEWDKVETIPSLHCDAYFTREKVVDDIRAEIMNGGGRVSLNDIQMVVNVDMHYIDIIAHRISCDDPEILLVGGEILTKQYLCDLCEDINDIVQNEGMTTIGNLSRRFQLPLDIVTETVKSRLGSTIHASYKGNMLCSELHMEQQRAFLRGCCLAVSKPVPVTTLSSQVTGLDETAVYQYISKLTKPGSSGAGSDTSPYLSGNCTAKEYSPSVFKESQRRVVDEHFQINGVIEYITLTKHKVVSKQLEFVQTSFPDAVGLSTCIVSSGVVATLESDLREVLSASPTDAQSDPSSETTWDGSGGIPYLYLLNCLPAMIATEDMENLFKAACDASKRSNESQFTPSDFYYINLPDGPCVVNKSFVRFLSSKLETDATRMGEALTIQLRSQHSKSTSIASVAMNAVKVADPEIDDDCTGKGKGKKGKKSRAVDTPEEPTVSSKGKKRDKAAGKKNSKANSKPSGDEEVTSDGLTCSVSSLIVPYIKDTRVLELLYGWCANVFEMGQELEGADEEVYRDQMKELIQGIWETLLKDASIEVYRRVAAKAKDDACQGGLADHMRKEEERDKKFEGMWQELQVVAKGLAVLEGRKIDDSADATLPGTAFLHEYILGTRCARIADLLTAFVCWENGVEYTAGKERCRSDSVCSQDSVLSESREIPVTMLSSEQRQEIIQSLPREIGSVVNRMWTLVVGGRQCLWDFIEFLETCSANGTMQLITHKVDKKKERNISFTMKQGLMDRLRPCNDLHRALPLLLSLRIYQISGCIAELPILTSTTNVVEHIFIYLQEHLEEEDMNTLKALRVMDPENLDESVLEHAKAAVLTKKK